MKTNKRPVPVLGIAVSEVDSFVFCDPGLFFWPLEAYALTWLSDWTDRRLHRSTWQMPPQLTEVCHPERRKKGISDTSTDNGDHNSTPPPLPLLAGIESGWAAALCPSWCRNHATAVTPTAARSQLQPCCSPVSHYQCRSLGEAHALPYSCQCITYEKRFSFQWCSQQENICP